MIFKIQAADIVPAALGPVVAGIGGDTGPVLMAGQNKMKFISQFIICKGFVRLRSPEHRVMEQGDFDMLSHIFCLSFPGHPEFAVFLFAVSPAAVHEIRDAILVVQAVDKHGGHFAHPFTVHVMVARHKKDVRFGNRL